MSPWKQAALAGYYHASRPYRAWWNRWAARAQRAPVMIVFYHRVADDALNGWTCSRDVFAQQMAWLKRHCDCVSLSEAQRRIREGNSRPAVVVTFDDGYADNNDFALPLLVREKIPCTYFVTYHNARHGMPFPHDMRMGHTLRPNTLNDLRHWAAQGIDIGAHTRTHPDIGKIDDRARLHDEITAAGEDLEQALGRAVRYFAFPFGMPANMSPAAFETAYEAGYDGVCSAYGAYNFPGDDPFHLQRIHADEDLLRFRNWLSIDPRKLNVPRYEYRRPSEKPSFVEPARREEVGV
ncbi:MAG: polysaccharide deacetylase family protein [Planctomycetales bacterium]|nr:polysaccharide deacetylase family protein [Planctomycetales bacterium]